MPTVNGVDTALLREEIKKGYTASPSTVMDLTVMVEERDNRIKSLVKSRDDWKESSARWFGKAASRQLEINRLMAVINKTFGTDKGARVMALSKCGGACHSDCEHYEIGKECPADAVYSEPHH